MRRLAKTASVSAPNAFCISIRAHCLKPKEWRRTHMTVRSRPRSALKSGCADTNAAARTIRPAAALNKAKMLEKSPVIGGVGPLTAGRVAPMVRRLQHPHCNFGAASPIIGQVHAAHRSRRAECDHSGAQSEQQEAGDPGTCGACGRAHRARTSAPFWKSCCSARSSAPPRSATASRSRTASCRSSAGCSACSRGCDKPIDFEALDNQPVDLVFLLLAPEGAGADHLKALARVARLLRDPEIARKLREFARCRRALRVLKLPPASSAA